MTVKAILSRKGNYIVYYTPYVGVMSAFASDCCKTYFAPYAPRTLF
jgi:hypothetical protein